VSNRKGEKKSNPIEEFLSQNPWILKHIRYEMLRESVRMGFILSMLLFGFWGVVTGVVTYFKLGGEAWLAVGVTLFAAGAFLVNRLLKGARE